MVDVDQVVFKVDVLDGQTAELRDAHPSVEQNVHDLIVFAVAVIVMDEFQKLIHLIPCDGFAGHAVVYHHAGKLKGERILVEQIIVHRHLKCRSQYAAHSLDRGIAPAVLLELDQKELRVRGLHLTDLLKSKLLFLQKINHEVVIHESVWPDTGFGGEVAFHQFQHGHIFLCRIEQRVKIPPDLLLKLAQRRTGLLPLRGGVGRLQAPTVDELDLAAHIVFELVLAVGSDRFAVPEHAVFRVTPFWVWVVCHFSKPPLSPDGI